MKGKYRLSTFPDVTRTLMHLFTTAYNQFAIEGYKEDAMGLFAQAVQLRGFSHSSNQGEEFF